MYTFFQCRFWIIKHKEQNSDKEHMHKNGTEHYHCPRKFGDCLIIVLIQEYSLRKSSLPVTGCVYMPLTPILITKMIYVSQAAWIGASRDKY